MKYQTISADQLDQMMDRKDFYLVNVHIPYEGNQVSEKIDEPCHKIANALHSLSEISFIFPYSKYHQHDRICATVTYWDWNIEFRIS